LPGGFVQQGQHARLEAVALAQQPEDAGHRALHDGRLVQECMDLLQAP
jgi:hypothetical protein